MTFEWADNLTLAQSQYREGLAAEDEAGLRCAIGRAYYAAFGTAADFLRSQGETINESTAHYDVWSTFGRYRDGTIESAIGTILRVMLRKRKWADYDNPYPGVSLQHDADDVISQAEVVLAHCGQLRAATD